MWFELHHCVMKASLRINLPEPCHEDWNQMTPAHKGRFCSACEKIVVDFTQFNDQELLDFFVHSKQKACGRFADNQLNRLVIETKPARQNAFFPALITALLSVSSLTSFGQNHQPVKSAYVIDSNTASVAVTKIKFTGIVSSEYKPLNRVKITVVGTDIEAYTNNLGYFEIALPQYVQNRNFTFQFSKPGYLPKEASTDQIARELNVDLVPIKNEIEIFDVVGISDRQTIVMPDVRTYAGVPMLEIEPVVKIKWWQFWKR